MEVFGLDPEDLTVGCIVMMEQPLQTLKVQPVNNMYSPQLKEGIITKALPFPASASGVDDTL
jgi:hypothetical protein